VPRHLVAVLKFKISVDIEGPMRLVRQELPKAVPYVKASMLTGLAGRIQDRVREAMPVAFDRPTPFTVRGVWVKSATTARPTAEVYFPESKDDRGLAKREYIRPGALGAPRRNQKRTEFLLTRVGVLPPGWVTTPGNSAARHGYIDGFGNVKPRIYAQIVNVLKLKQALMGARAKGISAASQKRAQRMGVEAEFFAVPPGKNAMGRGGSWLPPGVYKRVGRSGDSLHQVLKFVQRATYRQRLDVEAIARKEIEASLQPEFERAFERVKARFAQNAGKR
jgi:hypothetical protein